jgi:hypothetical protein
MQMQLKKRLIKLSKIFICKTTIKKSKHGLARVQTPVPPKEKIKSQNISNNSGKDIYDIAQIKNQ